VSRFIWRVGRLACWTMLLRFSFRLLRGVSFRLLFKAATLWVFKGVRAVNAFKRRVAKGELFPPFLFLALTDACNLRCRGCWIGSEGNSRVLELEDVERLIVQSKRKGSYFFTLLGGEPFLYPNLWRIIERHRECYFQIITNGLFLDDEAAERIQRLGNVTVLVSIDGLREENDARRGQGVFDAAIEGCNRLAEKRILFGIATTVTGRNMEETACDAFVERMIDLGAMYLWYYVFRPVGADPAPELCLGRERMLELRKRLLRLRRKHPIIIVDTYWNAEGEAVCPAALGLGYHIGPGGSIEPCPPLSFATETIRDNGGDLVKTIGSSAFLKGFGEFVHARTKGCVILECPRDLVRYLRDSGAADTSGRDAYEELAAGEPRTSHHLPGEEIPEDYWVYRMLKRQLFFGLGGYG